MIHCLFVFGFNLPQQITNWYYNNIPVESTPFLFATNRYRTIGLQACLGTICQTADTIDINRKSHSNSKSGVISIFEVFFPEISYYCNGSHDVTHLNNIPSLSIPVFFTTDTGNVVAGIGQKGYCMAFDTTCWLGFQHAFITIAR